MNNMRWIILIIIALTLVSFIIMRKKIHFHIRFIMSDAGCFIEASVKWLRIPLVIKHEKLDLEEWMEKAKELKDYIPREGPELYQRLFIKKIKDQLFFIFEHAERVSLQTDIWMGWESPVATALITGVMYGMKSLVLAWLNQVPAIQTSFRIHPEFQSAPVNMRFESMIDILPGQAIHIIIHLIRAGKGGLK